jgi:hypothetical protein
MLFAKPRCPESPQGVESHRFAAALLKQRMKRPFEEIGLRHWVATTIGKHQTYLASADESMERRG